MQPRFKMLGARVFPETIGRMNFGLNLEQQGDRHTHTHTCSVSSGKAKDMLNAQKARLLLFGQKWLGYVGIWAFFELWVDRANYFWLLPTSSTAFRRAEKQGMAVVVDLNMAVVVIDLCVKSPRIMTSFMHMCHVPHFCCCNMAFGSRTG